ncbi:hypothetical protein phytr_5850 [Candidatus Phycorickettsia trachydisci]|uniref:DUF1189 domain-containing protein n=1 Tax=Candidatus Phycorickettsia trachydisci TaxID=2115978 RepID=A0A2P1P8C7_9RICK|nr:DUF1189 family protein [Candidatus Phycorickettsia trachydisci]AVP87528.1 hypothetical protein phytr_5850 [Candidatus Phycorickettsia trachydisci]
MTAKLNQYLNIWKLLICNLFLSLFSVKFYEKIYKNFQGFGFKYFLSCLLIASIIKSTILFIDLQQIVNYLKYDQQNYYSSLLQSFFTQFPTIQYDGKSIAIEKDEALDIANPFDETQKLLSITSSGKNDWSQSSLIVLSKENLIINSSEKPYIIPYYKIDTKPSVINGDRLKTLIGFYISEFKYQIWSGIFFAICFVFASVTFSRYIFLIAIISFVVKFILNKDLQNCIRTIMFAIAGISAIQLLIPLQLFSYYTILNFSLATIAILKAEKAYE